MEHPEEAMNRPAAPASADAFCLGGGGYKSKRPGGPSVNRCPVFISSSDAYADIWPAFFTLFKRAWPDYCGTLYLNTETRTFAQDGLNIVCTRVGRQRRFGETLAAGLAQVPSDVFLLLMIDYFIERPVDVPRLDRLYAAFRAGGPTALFLMPHAFPAAEPVAGLADCLRVRPPYDSVCFSFQAAFWRKASLRRLVVPWEDPWRTEFYAHLRTRLLRHEVWVTRDLPLAYDPSGVLHNHGQWLMSALAKIDLTGVPLDLSRRATYRPVSLRTASRRTVLHDLLPTPSNIRSVLSLVRLFLSTRRFPW